MQYLTNAQRARVEQLARDKGVICKHCGSAELCCGETARHYLGFFDFELWCQNESGHCADSPSSDTLRYFHLTAEEAHAIGIS